ncbi:hypothetical protein [Taibaiella sp. KBW10]|uniref:hypothetical protein n=1 Tax=Taibaiella sp. KBW10 TaxID=2153357 RepID=UPI000F5AFD2D|nr:hypothetical protein [Taibaiella sp. KBW10]
MLFNLIAVSTAYLKIKNLPFLHLYTVLEFCTLSLLFKSLLKGKVINNILSISIVLFPIVAIGYIGYNDALYKHNVLPRFLSSMSITILCVYFLIRDLTQIKDNQSVFSFMVIVGLLLYFATCSTLFGFSSKIMEMPDKINDLLWNIHASMALIMYLIFAYAYFKLNRQHG